MQQSTCENAGKEGVYCIEVIFTMSRTFVIPSQLLHKFKNFDHGKAQKACDEPFCIHQFFSE